jgi:hypothetical protein
VAKTKKAEGTRTVDQRQLRTTCERDYTDAEIEFMHALDKYKRASGRMFPTCSEILEVLNALGYRKIDDPNTAAKNATEDCCSHTC